MDGISFSLKVIFCCLVVHLQYIDFYDASYSLFSESTNIRSVNADSLISLNP
jgi:hypothetical protein